RGGQKGREGDVLSPLGLLNALQRCPQPGLQAECRVDGLVQGERLAGFAAGYTPLGRVRQLAFFGVVSCLGLPETGRAFVGGLLGYLLGRGEFLADFEVHRGKNSLGEVFLVAVPLVAATEWTGQQEESEKRWPHSESSGYDRWDRQGQISWIRRGSDPPS